MTTHNELYHTSHPYLLLLQGLPATYASKCANCTNFGEENGNKNCQLLAIKGGLKIQHQTKEKLSQTLPNFQLTKPSLSHPKPSASFGQTEEKFVFLCVFCATGFRALQRGGICDFFSPSCSQKPWVLG